MRYCLCGMPLPPRARKCISCGLPASEALHVQVRETTRSSIGCGAVVIVLALVLLMAVWIKHKPASPHDCPTCVCVAQDED